MTNRECSRPSCRGDAATTLTYDYADSLIVVGPLSPLPEPHGYDLCALHTSRFSAPQGWQVMRHAYVEH